MLSVFFLFFFFNDTATTEIYTLSLHDALPILVSVRVVVQGDPRLALGAAAVRQHSSRPDAAGRCTAARASRVTAHLRRRPPNLAVAHGAGSAASSAGGLAAGAAGAVCGTPFRERRGGGTPGAGVGRGPRGPGPSGGPRPRPGTGAVCFPSAGAPPPPAPLTPGRE